MIAFVLIWWTIPGMQEKHALQVAALLTAFHEELAAERKQHGEWITAIVGRLDRIEDVLNTRPPRIYQPSGEPAKGA